MSIFKQTTIDFDPQYTSAFGTLETNELDPVIQLDFIHGLNNQNSKTTVSGTGASVDTTQSMLRVQSGTASNGSAIFRSYYPVKYRPGQGTEARFTFRFDNGIADNTQIVGVGSSTDGYFFGYNGTTFGILHRNSATGSTVNTWIAQTDWNGDKLNGSGASGLTLNPLKLNVAKIVYPFLGAGNIEFYIEHQNKKSFILVHTIRYNGQYDNVQLSNASLYFWAQQLNSGNATNKSLYVGSVGCFVSGFRTNANSPKGAIDNNKSGITTETNLLTLKNATTYNTISSRALIRLTRISFSSSGNTGIAVFRLKINPTVGGSPSFSAYNGTTADGGTTITNGQSIVSIDTAGTTITVGQMIYSFTCDNPNSSQDIDLEPLRIFIAPSDILSITGFSTASSQLGCSVCWVEDI